MRWGDETKDFEIHSRWFALRVYRYHRRMPRRFFAGSVKLIGYHVAQLDSHIFLVCVMMRVLASRMIDDDQRTISEKADKQNNPCDT
jgi:hypothetical protein